uniref:Uncharacterized protein n=1 Tax=Myotis myotis TaxID=51298 RepID=A0A7J7U5J8_MYOMY|nr:hypothetical protein mMyoMyo1_008882 [Myotis myotis]
MKEGWSNGVEDAEHEANSTPSELDKLTPSPSPSRPPGRSLAWGPWVTYSELSAAPGSTAWSCDLCGSLEPSPEPWDCWAATCRPVGWIWAAGQCARGGADQDPPSPLFRFLLPSLQCKAGDSK